MDLDSSDKAIMRTLRPVLFSWSGGKDSCLTLYEIQRTPKYQVAALLTTVTKDFDRISMHGVRRALLVEQAISLGLPLREVVISKGATNEVYEEKLLEVIERFSDRGIDSIIFGDLFLEDIRKYRDEFLARHKLRGIYPVWQRQTAEFLAEFVNLGFKAIVTCVDDKALDSSFAGRLIDQDFICELPPQVDPCGENGEFHTFVFDGPNFKQPVNFTKGEIVLRDGFWFCDLLPQAQLA